MDTETKYALTEIKSKLDEIQRQIKELTKATHGIKMHPPIRDMISELLEK